MTTKDTLKPAAMWWVSLARCIKIAAMATRIAGYEASLPRRVGL